MNLDIKVPFFPIKPQLDTKISTDSLNIQSHEKEGRRKKEKKRDT